jgi:chorismate mutase
MADPKVILKDIRERIDDLDEQIVDLLAEREQVIYEAAELKKEHNLRLLQTDRVGEVRDRVGQMAVGHGMDPHVVRAIYTLLMGRSHEIEGSIMIGRDVDDEDGIKRKVS